MTDFTFLTTKQYFENLINSTKQSSAGDSITITTMAYNPKEPLIDELLMELAKAAARKVDVLLLIDARTFLVDDSNGRFGPLFYHATLPTIAKLKQPFKSSAQHFRALKDNGGKCIIINQPKKAFSFIDAGRSHIKVAIIQNRIYVGGCNLWRADWPDVMVSWEDTAIATQLKEICYDIAREGNVKKALHSIDTYFVLDAAATLFMDAGVSKQSVIYEQALQLIDDAKERLFITCQFFPGGQTARHLHDAYVRGVDVQIVFSHPSAHRIALLHHTYQAIEQRRWPKSFFENRRSKNAPLLHAKVLVSEKAAMVGSHNYVTQGVTFGTAELALLSRNPAFATQLVNCITKQL